MQEISISYLPRLKDHTEAYKAYKSSTMMGKTDRIIDIIALILGLGIILFPLFGERDSSVSIWGYVIIVIALLHMLEILDAGKFATMRQFKSNQKFKKTQHIIFNEEGLEYDMEGIKSSISWGFYTSYLESANTFLLIHSKKQYSVFPKDAFNENDLLNFRKLLETKFK